MKLVGGAVVLSALLLVGGEAVLASQSSSSGSVPSRVVFRAAWTRTLDANADSVPAYLARVRLANGQTRAMVYVVAGNNGSDCDPSNPLKRATLYALDASSGAIRWKRSTSGASRCTTSAPAAYGGWVYAPGLDGRVHRYNAGTGREYRGNGWPKTVTLIPSVEKVSANLRITPPYLYVTTSGFIGDQGHYEGHLVVINLRTGHQIVFNSLCSHTRHLLSLNLGQSNYCSAVQSGLFGRGQAVTDLANHDVYIVSGNGPWNGITNWGDSVLKLTPSGSRLLDAFTPTNQSSLNTSDQDLGSTGPAILPGIKFRSRTYHLLVQGGKGPACDGCSGVALRLLNADNLSGRRGPGHLGGDLQDIQSPGGCEVLTAPAVWTSASRIHVFYANDCGIAGYTVTTAGARIRLTKAWSDSVAGTTPVMSRGVLYVARTGAMTAYNPSNGSTEGSTSIGGIHWEYPLVVGHRLYLTDQSGRITAYNM